jgi:predicted outer membrane repeat protein
MAENAMLNLTTSILDSNRAELTGGGIALSGKGYINITNTDLVNNSAITSGGSIHTSGSIDITVQRSSIHHNNAGMAAGVALYGEGVSSFESTSMTHNTATTGAQLLLSVIMICSYCVQVL